MSHMSTCDAPPLRKKRIVERALPGDVLTTSFATAFVCPKPKPATPAVEATTSARRLSLKGEVLAVTCPTDDIETSAGEIWKEGPIA